MGIISADSQTRFRRAEAGSIEDAHRELLADLVLTHLHLQPGDGQDEALDRSALAPALLHRGLQTLRSADGGASGAMHQEVAVPLEHAHHRLHVADRVHLAAHRVRELANHLPRRKQGLAVCGEGVEHEAAHEALEVESEPRMHLELPCVGELMEDQPGPEVGAFEREVTLDRRDVGLDKIQRARLAFGAGERPRG